MSKAKNSNAPWTIEDDRYLLDALHYIFFRDAVAVAVAANRD